MKDKSLSRCYDDVVLNGCGVEAREWKFSGGDSEHHQREGEDMHQNVTQKFERG
jgi:hypothetical protein